MTTNKQVYIERFNVTAQEFVTQLCTLFPDVVNFQRFRTGLSLLVACSPNQPQNIFDMYVAQKYKDKILAKDENFFMTTDYDINDDDGNQWSSFINVLCQLWRNLDTNNKESIWKFFGVLIVLNDKCNEA